MNPIVRNFIGVSYCRSLASRGLAGIASVALYALVAGKMQYDGLATILNYGLSPSTHPRTEMHEHDITTNIHFAVVNRAMNILHSCKAELCPLLFLVATTTRIKLLISARHDFTLEIPMQ